MQALDIVLSDEQLEVVQTIGQWLHDRTAAQHLTFGGLAGTGKTTVIGKLGEVLHLSEVIYCAPTGKAARVLSSKLNGEYGFVKTIHQLIYSASEIHCSTCPKGRSDSLRCHADAKSDCGCKVRFDRKADKSAGSYNVNYDGSFDYEREHDASVDASLVVVDESSMVDEKLFTDLMSHVGSTKVLFVGDHGQLPPVNGKFNLMDDPDIRLETIHRQNAGSPIIQLAMEARTSGRIAYGDYGQNVRKIRRADAKGFRWNDETLFICRTNKMRVYWNTNIRLSLGYNGDPQPGEKVICLKNDWNAQIYNGLTGTISEIERLSDFYYHADIALDDGRMFNGMISADQFGKESTLLDDGGAALFDFGYCLTCHKSQGSQANSVVVFPEWAPYVERDGQFKRWLYTAITRAEKELLIIE